MLVRILTRWLCLLSCWVGYAVAAQETLPATQPLSSQADRSARMVAGIDKFLLHETDTAAKKREQFWQRDFSSPEAYEASIATNRAHLRKLIGAVDRRLPVSSFEAVAGTSGPTNVAETDGFTVQAVRWPVFEGVFGEGLWLQPKGEPTARVVAIPDADETPEMLVGLSPGLPPERQFARRLAEHGCEVLVPVLLDRQDTWSGSEAIHRFTNQPHREWIYRQAFELGRHIIGYEAEKVLAAVDCFELESFKATNKTARIGVAGYAEGGLLAFYAAALDPRIQATLVSGYFDSRQRLWREPIYRNVFGLLVEFGDAEIATLITPRTLVVEHSPVPRIDGPPAPRPGRNGAAPGRLATPDYDSVETEFERARTLLKVKQNKAFDQLHLICGNEGMETGPASDRALLAFLHGLGIRAKQVRPPATTLADSRNGFDPTERQHRQVKELEAYTQKVYRESEPARSEFLWKQLKASSAAEWAAARVEWKERFWNEVIGRFPSPTLPLNAHSRKVLDRPQWTGYEVTLDVFPDVVAWGYLLVPRNIPSGERRPVVVCQHGLEGLPNSVFNEDTSSEDFKYYKAFGARLAEQGFVVFAPHNPYKGHDNFRALQRKANPVQKTLFSVITAQHERLLEWLGQLPFVDAKRIGFYGLSYGGTTALRVPAVLDGYALSICSGNFNDWVRKNTSLDSPTTYMTLGEYEMPEFDLGHTFNHAEMAALIAPRPFMVERGHNDPVGVDEWVASEYAKVKRLYDQLGLPDRTAIEYFDGGHAINGVGTFDFLHRQLAWPKAAESSPH
jgi:dienelactone hydrolase